MGIINHDAYACNFTSLGLVDTYICIVGNVRVAKEELEFVICGTFHVYYSLDMRSAGMEPINHFDIKLTVSKSDLVNPFDMLYAKLKELYPNYLDVIDVIEPTPEEPV